MRIVFPALLLAAALPLAAADSKPVPPPPPIPPASADDPAVGEPEVTIVQKEDATVTEYRMAGRLYMVKVTPKVGPEYYLVDDDGTGQMVRRDGQRPLRPPMWVIKRF
ncbi:DUF2782 domain-containing protein [Chitinimonas koreensis]|uniref:DUF2782 domain-containing protein n=1 Tax=Chitinimonas koreensis TaxID=356302 RepID=UPI000416CCD7|nr:DUF2782 domain-containing protein [Chitinimonas koreensis]QNM97080.1 DUF2782 domain-containing protein [Chitinimonas koreensis]